MIILMRRWSRSAYAPWWFYALMCGGFAVLAAFGVIRGDWLVVVLAAVMFVVAAAAARLMPKLARAAEESKRLHYEDRGTE
jgi:hypothetical protein